MIAWFLYLILTVKKDSPAQNWAGCFIVGHKYKNITRNRILTEGKRKDMIWHEIWHKKIKPWKLKALRTGDERIELPPKVLETPIIPFDQSPIYKKKWLLATNSFTLYSQNYIHACWSLIKLLNQFLTCVSWSSPHPISNSQLHVLPHFHLCPIYLVVFKGVYFFTNGISHLKGGFTLRCLQRLSLPDLATRPWLWQANRSTSGPSIPVLSY